MMMLADSRVGVDIVEWVNWEKGEATFCDAIVMMVNVKSEWDNP